MDFPPSLVIEPHLFLNEFGGNNGHKKLFMELCQHRDTTIPMGYNFKHPEPLLGLKLKNIYPEDPITRMIHGCKEPRVIPSLASDYNHYDFYETLYRIAFHEIKPIVNRVMGYMNLFSEINAANKFKGVNCYFDYAPIAQLAFWIVRKYLTLHAPQDNKPVFQSVLFGTGFCNPPIGKDLPPYYKLSLVGDEESPLFLKAPKGIKQHSVIATKELLFKKILKIIDQMCLSHLVTEGTTLEDIFRPDRIFFYGGSYLDPYAELRRDIESDYFFPPLLTPKNMKTPGEINCFGYIRGETACQEIIQQLGKYADQLRGHLVLSEVSQEVRLQLKKIFQQVRCTDVLLGETQKQKAFKQADFILSNGSIGFLGEAIASNRPVLVFPSAQVDQRITAQLGKLKCDKDFQFYAIAEGKDTDAIVEDFMSRFI